MTDERHHTTFRDYLLTLRRRRFLILGILLVAAIFAGVLSELQKKTYTAQASLQALDVSQNAGYAGILAGTQTVPQITSAQLAQTATRPDVLAALKTALHLNDPPSRIASRLTFTQDQQSNFVVVTATAGTTSGAANLANAAAAAITQVSNADVRKQFAQFSASDSRDASNLLAPFAGKPSRQLPVADQAREQGAAQEANQLEQIAARLIAFSKVVTVAQVATRATPPGSPTSPHIASNVIIGVILGLILALLLTWFLESLDRRLRRPDEAESIFRLPIVSAVPQGDLGKVPRGDADGLNLTAFRMLRTNVRFLSSRGEAEPPRSILVTSALAEEGKTTVAFGLAMSAAASGVKTLLIEADVHRPVHAKRLGLEVGPGLADYLAGSANPADILQVYSPADHAGDERANGRALTLSCITAGNVKSFPAIELGSEKFAAVVSEVTQAYDLVVIDTAPLLAIPETLEMMQFVDASVFCARLGQTTVEQARGARESLSRLPRQPAGLVLTDLDHATGGYYGYMYAYDYSPTESPEPAKTA